MDENSPMEPASRESEIEKDEAVGGDICKHGAAELSDQSAWRWVNDLVEKPSKEIISQIKENPGLISKRITIECLPLACTCSDNFEKLEFDLPLSRRGVPEQLQAVLDKGRCPHVLLNTNSIKSTETADRINNTLEDTQHETKQHVGTISAGITAIHVASILGKVRVIEYIVHALKKINETSSVLGCDEMFTTKHRHDPFYLAVLWRQDRVLKTLGSVFNKTMGLGRDVVYQRVIYNSVMLAVQEDNVQSLRTILTTCRWKRYYFYIEDTIHSALQKSIRKGHTECLKCLCKEGKARSPSDCLDTFFSCRCLEPTELFQGKDLTVVKELFRMGGVKCRQIMLYNAVYLDNIDMTSFILRNHQKMVTKKRVHFCLPVIIQAVLNNSTKMLEILLRSDFVWPYKRYRDYTALDWARVLHFDECAVLLERAGVPYNPDVIQNYPPLVMLFDTYIDSVYFSKSALIQRLLQNGNNVNAETVKGKTALNMALESQSYPELRQLLLAGADPFGGLTCLSSFLSLRLIGELLYANTDISQRRNGVSIFHRLVLSFPKFHCHLVFLLKHAHTMSKSDLKLLNSLHDCDIVSRDILEQIAKYLETPKSLLLRARDVVRRQYGYRIHYLVRSCNLPVQINSILTLDGLLDNFLSSTS